ncbi:MAG TPA: toll/interleukin-1 receptor domain-containing protein [Bryobacteraceae bacterium]
MPPPLPGTSIFLSYTRKDFYFAESLASHLELRGVEVWFDAKNLEPGEFWDREIEAAINSARCIVLVASPESIYRPYVRAEWERAKRQGTRIVLALFRSVRLPSELEGCDVVDFRGSFAPALARLTECLNRPPGAAGSVNTGFSLRLPPWVYIIGTALLLPLAAYLRVGDWSDPPGNIAIQALSVGVFVALFGWFFFLAFLRRRMGMTRLFISLAALGTFITYPLLRYIIGGRSNLNPGNDDIDAAVLTHFPLMAIAALVWLAGLALIVGKRPDDLLRWTPTGKAWNWYRRASLARLSAVRERPAREVKTYRLSYDVADSPAAERFRQEMRALGAMETPRVSEAETSILLLTSRTRSEWLTAQERELPANALLVVGSPIGLLERFEHLWRREWMDVRHWDRRQIEGKQTLLDVPEAVTVLRFPSEARLAHRVLCCVASLALATMYAINPSLMSDAPLDNGGELAPSAWLAIAVPFYLPLAVSLSTCVLAQRFLNRTISAPGFRWGWRIALGAAALLTAWALAATILRHDSTWALSLALPLLAAGPFLLTRLEHRLAFWFPSSGMAKPGKEERLKPGRNWQTFLWGTLWVAFWLFLTQWQRLA